MVLGSLWGAGLPFLGEHKLQTLQRFSRYRDLQSAGIFWAQIFLECGLLGDRGFQGTEVFRGQRFSGDRDLQGFVGAGVHRE